MHSGCVRVFGVGHLAHFQATTLERHLRRAGQVQSQQNPLTNHEIQVNLYHPCRAFRSDLFNVQKRLCCTSDTEDRDVLMNLQCLDTHQTSIPVITIIILYV